MRIPFYIVAIGFAVLVIGGTFAVGGQGSLSQGRIDPELYESWNSPTAEARAQRALESSIPRRAYRSHGYDDGLAISPDGRLLVSATPQAPVNSLEVLEPHGRLGWRIVHPHPRVGLLDPAFSPDGERLAFVVGLPSAAGEFSGVSAIWIVDRRGQPLTIISTPGRLFRRPVFSPDGKRIAYARDVFEHVAPHRPLPPENQSAKPLSLFETDLETGQARRLSDERYMSLRPVGYGPSGAGLFYQAAMRMVPVEPGSAHLVPDRAYWRGPKEIDGRIPLELFHLESATGAIHEVGGSFAPIPGRGPGGLLGLTPKGEAILKDTTVNGATLDWSVYVAASNGIRRVAAGREDQYVQAPAASAIGGSYAALLTSRLRGGTITEVHGVLLGHLVGAEQTVPTRLDFAKVAFRKQPVVLDATVPPAGNAPCCGAAGRKEASAPSSAKREEP